MNTKKIISITLKHSFWIYKEGKVFTYEEFKQFLEEYCSNASEPIPVNDQTLKEFIRRSSFVKVKYEK